MIVKNEERNLAACLEGYSALVDELVIVDTGSTDGTIDIARQAGAVVVETKWDDDFSKARNLSIENASSDWILWTDADDRINAENCAKIRKIIESYSLSTCFSFMIKNSQDGILGDVFNQVRLFPRHPKIRFRYRVHEQVLPSIQALGYDTLYTDIIVFHTGYDSAETVKKKQARNVPILLKEMEDRKENPVIVYTYAGALVDTGKLEESIKYYKMARDLSEKFQTEDHIRCGAPIALASVYGRLERWDEAKREAIEADRLNPNHPQVHCMLGELAAREGKTDEAINFFEAVLKMDEAPSFIPVNVNMQKINACTQLGALYFKKGETDKMIAAVEQAVSIKQGRPLLPSDRGDAFVKAGMFDKAVEVYAEGVNNTNICDLRSFIGLAKLFIIDNRCDTAIDILNTAIDNFGDSEEILELLADIYYDLKLNEKAKQTYLRLHSIVKDSQKVAKVDGRLSQLA